GTIRLFHPCATRLLWTNTHRLDAYAFYPRRVLYCLSPACILYPSGSYGNRQLSDPSKTNTEPYPGKPDVYRKNQTHNPRDPSGPGGYSLRWTTPKMDPGLRSDHPWFASPGQGAICRCRRWRTPLS